MEDFRLRTKSVVFSPCPESSLHQWNFPWLSQLLESGSCLDLFGVCIVVVVQSLSHVWLFATPWTKAHQASLPFLISLSLLKLMSIESVMPSDHFILCPPFSSCLQSFPASGSFPMSWLYESGGQSIRVSVLASVLPMNIQGWFLLGLTGLISLLSKGLSRVFSSTTVQKYIVCIICIILGNPLLRSGAPQAPPIFFQHTAEFKTISACQPFTPPHCLSPIGDSVAQTLLTYLKNSKLLQLKKKIHA